MLNKLIFLMIFSEDEINDLHKLFPSRSLMEIATALLNSESIDNAAERLMDSNTITISLQEYLYNANIPNKRKQNRLQPTLYYPLLFNAPFIKRVDVNKLRAQSLELKARIEYYYKMPEEKASWNIGHFKSDTIDILRRRRDAIDYLASEYILYLMMKDMRPGKIDLHNLFLKEALGFVEDYIMYFRPSNLEIIVGKKDATKKIRPCVSALLLRHRYRITESEGSIFCCKRKQYEHQSLR